MAQVVWVNYWELLMEAERISERLRAGNAGEPMQLFVPDRGARGPDPGGEKLDEAS